MNICDPLRTFLPQEAKHDTSEGVRLCGLCLNTSRTEAELDDKVIKLLLIGYSRERHGYKLLEYGTKRVLHCKDVTLTSPVS